jgi:hypothetical protein
MNFKQQLEEDIQKIYFNVDEGATVVVYTPKGGAPTTVEALIVSKTDLEIDVKGASSNLEVMVKKSDIPTSRYGDKILIEGDMWTVYRVLWGNPGANYLEVRRDERARF